MKNRDSVLETPTLKKWIDDDGIVHAVIPPGTRLGRVELERDMAASDELFGVFAAPVLTDARGLVKVDREARKYSASERSDLICALAVLVESPLSKVLANFFYKVNAPPYPTRVFTSESEALEWLRAFVPR